jgi:hypothetical protein
VHDDVVQGRQRRPAHPLGPEDPGLQREAVLHLAPPVQHGGETLLELRFRGVREKAQPPQIDPEQWDLQAPDEPCGPEQRAVPSQGDEEVRGLALEIQDPGPVRCNLHGVSLEAQLGSPIPADAGQARHGHR